MAESTVTENDVKHTHGPWTAEPIPTDAHTDPDIQLPQEFVFWIAESRIAGHVLAVVEQIPQDPATAEANASLIAAAPEMYEALRWVLPLAESYLAKAPGHPDNAKLESARAAIAKAEGQS